MRKSSSFFSSFFAFVVGAIIVVSLMFASNKLHLFTGGSHDHALEDILRTPNRVNSQSTTLQAATLDMDRPQGFSEIAKQASPAVVKIETKVKSNKRSSGNNLYNDPFFRQFFGDMFGDNGNEQDPNQGDGLVPNGMGSGFIFEKSGYILTNEHVVDGADEIDVTVQGYDKPFKAKLLGSSYDLDLAAIKIDGTKDFPTLPIGNSNDAQVGDWVMAIGNPYDFDYTVTVGVLSAKERPISIPDQNGIRSYKHLLQTDAKINPGNSGGPLLNLKGEVIGINTAVSAQAQGIGFAIPTSTVSQVLDNLKNNVKIPREPIPYIGVSITNLQSDWLKDLKVDNTEGALVQSVSRKTPAFEAGIRQYDVIVGVNGKKVIDATDLTKQVQSAKVGDTLTLTIIRIGQKQEMKVVVGDRNMNPGLPQQ